MIGVALSGVVGRYIYIQIPRTREGQQISASELEQMDAAMMNKLVEYRVSDQILRSLKSADEAEVKGGWGSRCRLAAVGSISRAGRPDLPVERASRPLAGRACPRPDRGLSVPA